MIKGRKGEDILPQVVVLTVKMKIRGLICVNENWMAYGFWSKPAICIEMSCFILLKLVDIMS